MFQILLVGVEEAGVDELRADGSGRVDDGKFFGGGILH